MPPPARDPRIRAAEQALHELGISGSAEIGGHEGEILVLQVAHHAWEGLLDEEAIRVADRMKALGFRYVALDFAPNGAMEPPVYLDYAATSAVRPEAVVDAVAAYLRDIGATPGRAGHRRALDAGRVMLRCRRVLAELLCIPGDPGRIAFQFNATHALNTAIFGLLRPGDRVVRTAYDHNSVRRPIAALLSRGVQETVLAGSPGGEIDLAEAERALLGTGMAARLLVLPHASNVLGTVLPVAELAKLARAAGTLVLLDAAQTVGHLPVDATRLGVDLLAFTGHKGLLGPQGTGGLWVREGVDVVPLLYGGTGGESWPAEMPAALPDRLEAGTQNAPGFAGLLAGAQWVAERGVQALHGHTHRLKAKLRSGLRDLPGVTLRSPAAPEGVGIVTLTVQGIDSATLAGRLDRE
ncbi:MAG: aminotransferase class V-fold PLP-dependent enzyme, partial [Gemmatimonadetes bacterium]|nr:aminotransferase class V-fold PLP-dependent enzyme [Gemmatimonadota bacterium]